MALSKIFVLGLIFGFVQLFSVDAKGLARLGHHTPPGGLKVTGLSPVTLPVTTPDDILGKAGKLLSSAGSLLGSTPSLPLTAPDLGLTTPDLGLTTLDLGLTTPAGDPADNDMMDMLGKCADMMKDLADMMKAIMQGLMDQNGDSSTTPDPLGDILSSTLVSLDPLGITLGSTLPPLDNLLGGSTTPDPSALLDDIRQPKGMRNKGANRGKHNKPSGMNNDGPDGMNDYGQPDNGPNYSESRSQAFAKSGGQPDNGPNYSDARSQAFAESGSGSRAGAYSQSGSKKGRRVMRKAGRGKGRRVVRKMKKHHPRN